MPIQQATLATAAMDPPRNPVWQPHQRDASDPSKPYLAPEGQISNPGIPAALSDNLRKKKIPKLDALRAVNALIVVMYHFGFPFLPTGTGVMIFFVISGFLITRLLLEEFDKTSRISLGHFLFPSFVPRFSDAYVFLAPTVGGLLLKHGHVLWGQVVAAAIPDIRGGRGESSSPRMERGC
jgi:hypothetical protein